MSIVDNIIKSKSDILLNSLTKFFSKKNRINIMLNIIEGNSKISLRELDWFVTNYSKKYKVKYDVKNEYDVLELFVVHLEYKSQLKAYNKKLFDPFCRRSRINFKYDDNKIIVTTIGQLNFFRWAIKHNIIKYVIEHKEEIDTDMIKVKKEKKQKKEIYKKIINLPNKLIDESSSEDLTTESSNNKLIVSAVKTIIKNKEKIILTFE
jgi:hypothetical protein